MWVGRFEDEYETTLRKQSAETEQRRANTEEFNRNIVIGDLVYKITQL